MKSTPEAEWLRTSSQGGLDMADRTFALPTHEPRVVHDPHAPSAETPAWFAAAASQADILATAPELLAADVSGEVTADQDLVDIYAPEYREHFSAQREPFSGPAVAIETIGTADPHDIVVRPVVDTTPRTSVQMGLLREIAFLDG